MKELGLFWFVPKGGVPNLGDELGRIALETLGGFKVEKKGLFSCDAISAGSILGWGWEKGGFKNRTTPLAVLGSGLMHPYVKIDSNVNLDIYAARGELTKAILNNHGYSVDGIGDLGLIAKDFLFENDLPAEKKYELSFIPHHSRYDFYKKKFNNHNINFIDMRTSDIKNLLLEISKSKLVVSESLHGLVFSDSLNVPNAWFSSKDLHIGGEFKFKDYFSSIGRSSFKKTDSLINIKSSSFFDDWNGVEEGIEATRGWFGRFVTDFGAA